MCGESKRTFVVDRQSAEHVQSIEERNSIAGRRSIVPHIGEASQADPIRRNRMLKREEKLRMKEETLDAVPYRILFIDAYDSFSNSIIALLTDSLSSPQGRIIVEKIPIDAEPFISQSQESHECFRSFLAGFDAVVAGPGPGKPEELKDVGLMKVLWSLADEDLLPVFAICLGFQSMCLEAGASVSRLKRPRHGIITEIVHSANSLYANTGPVQATHYHSLYVDISHKIQDRPGVKNIADLWGPSSRCPSIIPLAWDCSEAVDQSILMAAKIKDKPFWGVQYHPESICSNKEAAKKLMTNWWEEAKAWICRSRAPKSAHLTAVHDMRDIVTTPMSSNCSDYGEPAPKRRRRSASESGTSTDYSGKHASIRSKNASEPQPAIAPDTRLAHDRVTEHIHGFDENSLVADLAAANLEVFESDSELDGSQPPYEEDMDSDEPQIAAQPQMVPLRYGGFEYSPQVYRSKGRVVTAVRKRIVKHVREILNTSSEEVLVLESGQSERRQGTGRFSIIGLVDESSSVKICYYRSRREVVVWRGSVAVHKETVADFATYRRGLRSCMSANGGDEKCPFWGGMFYCYSYEAALETIGVPADPSRDNGDRPDVVGLVVLRSVVIDHHYHDIWVQSIASNDDPWVQASEEAIAQRLNEFDDTSASYEELQQQLERKKVDEIQQDMNERFPARSSLATAEHADSPEPSPRPYPDGPSREAYIEKVRRCQEDIARGDSYELCLTAQTSITLPTASSRERQAQRDEVLYRSLTQRNPAPFGAYVRLRFGDTSMTVMSSSPERFLSWNRGLTCQFRPIKGTLRKREGMTMRFAETYFDSTKERAENLMITDLIRHDLYGVLKVPESVKVPALFKVEEYETVFQLVSVIEGRFGNIGKTGSDVLDASLPPGSMTGAPKKRSCELLQNHEDHEPRGMYSGVIGYEDVGGGGDFSVLIRAAVRWECDSGDGSTGRQEARPNMETWKIGAGGAITAQSNPEDEYAEMITKRATVLGAFSALFC